MTPEILKRFTALVEFLGQALGPDYEVTLHDLAPEHNCIVAIANGRISGRTVGSPLTNVALRMLKQKQYETQDYCANYTGIAASGKTIRSSTMFIRDDQGMPVGLLCINFDDSRFHMVSDTILKLVHPDEFVHHHYFPTDAPAKQPIKSQPLGDSTESFYNDVTGMMKELFDEVAAQVDIPLDRLTHSERTQMIAALNDRGLFRLKGAVQYATEMLACSQASIYRYLSKVKNDQQP